MILKNFIPFLMCVIALVFQASAQAEPVCSEKQATEQKYLSALILKKNYQSAIKHLRQQYSKQADHRILAQIKDIYLLDKNLSGWSEYLTKALSDNSRDPRIIFELAAIDIADKKYDLAFEKANHIFATTQSPEYAFEIYISAYSEIGEYKKVLELYDRYIQLSTKDDLYLRRAQVNYKLKNYIQADKDLQVFNSKGIASEEAHLLQVQLLQNRGFFSQADSQLKKCLVDFPEAKRCRDSLTVVNRKQNQYYLIEHFEKNQNRLVKNIDIVLDTAKMYEETRQLDKAEVLFQTATNLNPSSFATVLPLLQFYERHKQSAKAFQLLKKLDLLESENAQMSEYIRTVFSQNMTSVVNSQLPHEKSPDSNNKKEPLVQITDSKPQGRELFFNEEYKKLLKNKNLLVPNDLSYHFRLGVVYFRLQQLDNAISEWKKVSKASPSYISSLQNLAILMAKDGYKTKAVKFLKSQVLDLNGDESSEKLVEFIEQHISGAGRRPTDANEFKTNIIMKMNLGWE